MNDFTDRVALVTGCGSPDGIGMAVAQRLVSAGAKVAITSTTDRIFDRLAELGPGHFATTADLTDPKAVTRLFAETTAALGPIDILINNAGMVQTGTDVARAAGGGSYRCSPGHTIWR